MGAIFLDFKGEILKPEKIVPTITKYPKRVEKLPHKQAIFFFN
jgi:hypothetical protein